ncbi:unnamed protein product [Didymodactylos carnosus]|uniref:Uncharacterized protein n=1 Tax=Didymodactylos carnosus TaxID=1234261 RepID=A0A815END7_9BILA|nr:unnamed protein product [Didymodactylos carnosus]CAF1308783.1 unnamed protein product [Didymodactylos carnosus]CAF3856255.1 unnamed protein product [Didymodactylos carnosus]CAF4144536.1 unnamed protein product [Didymodactylos carnosus]
MDQVVYQHDLLQQLLVVPTPVSSTENDDKHIAAIMKKIDEWELRNIQQITTVAGRIRQQLQKRINEINKVNKVKHHFSLITNELRQSRSEADYVEADLQRWLEKLQQLKHQLETTTISGTSQIDVQITDDIDWSSMVKLVESREAKPTEAKSTEATSIEAKSAKLNFDLITTTEPQEVLDVPIAENYIRIGASNKSFLLYDNALEELHLYDQNGYKLIEQFTVMSKIWEIIWSSYLDRYLLQGDAAFYTYSEQNHQFEHLQQIKPSLGKRRYGGCTCFEEILLIYYKGWGCRIEEWNMKDFKIRKHWLTEVGFCINQMLFSIQNPNHIGVTVCDRQNIHRFELRDRDMKILKLVDIDQSKDMIFFIPISTTGDWLISYKDSNILSLINHDCTSKKIIEYSENVDQAVFVADYNCLAIATQNNQLHFYYL